MDNQIVEHRIVNLPDNILLNIFHYLPVTDLCLGVRQVSRCWRNLSYDFILWKKLSFMDNTTITDCQLRKSLYSIGEHVKKLELRGCTSLTKDFFQELPMICPHLQSLDLSHTNIDEDNVRNIVNSLENLEQFDCSHSIKVLDSSINGSLSKLTKLNRYYEPNVHYSKNHNSLLEVAANCEQLTFVRLSNTKLTDDIFERFFHTCEQITHLHIPNCTLISDEGLAEAVSHLPKLVSLDISLTHVSDRGILKVVNKCPNLKEIALSGCDQITDVAVTELAKGCAQLESLVINHIEECSANVTDTALLDVAKYCSKLKTFKVARSSVTDVGLSEVFKQCCFIITLNISGCISVTDKSIHVLVQSCPSLRHLEISQCVHITSNSVNQLFLKCENLVTVDAETCHNISKLMVLENDGLEEKIFSRLTHLNLSFCSKISDLCIKQVSQFCRHLKSLNIAGCYLVSDKAIDHVARQCQQLEHLVLSGKSAFQTSKLTDKSLCSVAEHCKTLATLEISKLKLISLNGIKRLIMQGENLKQMELTVGGRNKIEKQLLENIVIGVRTKCHIIREGAKSGSGRSSKETNLLLKFPSLYFLKRSNMTTSQYPIVTEDL